MKKIILKRGAGKTQKLIELAHNEKTYIVCNDKDEAKRIVEQAKQNGYNILFPITFHKFLKPEFINSTKVKTFLIDNIDDIIECLSLQKRIKIEAITMNHDNVIIENI